jgi:dethiobiotin synthetase
LTGRPPALVVIAGTGTEVGKTWTACQVACCLRAQGVTVAARKPAQSFSPGEEGSTDAELLAAATGEKATAVCPSWRWYAKAMAAPMAAESLGASPFSLADLVAETSWPPATQVGLVELAGGLGSPQASDGDGVDLVDLFAPDLVVLVAAAGLGTLSHINLARRALAGRAVGIYLNGFDPADEVHAANRRWLASNTDLSVTVRPDHLVGAIRAQFGGPGRSGTD